RSLLKAALNEGHVDVDGDVAVAVRLVEEAGHGIVREVDPGLGLHADEEVRRVEVGGGGADAAIELSARLRRGQPRGREQGETPEQAGKGTEARGWHRHPGAGLWQRKRCKESARADTPEWRGRGRGTHTRMPGWPALGALAANLAARSS